MGTPVFLVSSSERQQRPKKELTVAWLDTADTYGLVPHKPSEIGFFYQEPLHVKKIVKDYCCGIPIRFTVGEFTKA